LLIPITIPVVRALIYQDVIKNLEGGVMLNGWTLRKIFENVTSYDDAVSAVSSAQYASTEYAIMR